MTGPRTSDGPRKDGCPSTRCSCWPSGPGYAHGRPDCPTGPTTSPSTPNALGAPVPRPAGVRHRLNYPPHAAEAGFTLPANPSSSPSSQPPSPARTPRSPLQGKVDWEVELVAVIGRDTYRVSEDRAWEAVAGLTVGQDLSERVTQLQGRPPSSASASPFRASAHRSF
ncbi:fumarylacetoacetate hydrolase family protein, partial [Streptomyces sp. LBUM 1478]|nr:fumarylacetoacetate hydrolase family protein [Streptomyces sp. LBUM 1478]